VDECKPLVRARLTRALHSSTFGLDVSTVFGTCWVYCVVSVTKTAQVELRSEEVEATYTRSRSRSLFGLTSALFVGYVGCIAWFQ